MAKRRVTLSLAAFGLLAFGLLACGGDEQGRGSGVSCTPGETKVCTCPDGLASSRECAPSGRDYLPCDCAPVADAGGDVRSDATTDVPVPDGAHDTASDPGRDPGPDACVPACSERQCGADGCGGTCGTCPQGATCDEGGRCHSANCGVTPLTVSGGVVTPQGTLTFDTVAVTARHKQDVDAYEDGCLVELVIDLRRGAGCHLTVTAAERVDAGGALEVRQVTLSADSQCPGFSDDQEGEYALSSAGHAGDVDPGITRVPDGNAATSCFPATLPVRLQATLTRTSPAPALALALAGSTLVVSGDVTSTGSTTIHCPCVYSCDGRECGDDGCGVSCGACACGDECVAGACVFTACDGRECGDDGCGGSCGTCTEWPGSYCDAGGACDCQTQCAGKTCGTDGCGGTCGTCGCGQTCGAGGKCTFTACAGKACGSDGCGGSCGSCGCGETCQGGQCVDTACQGKVCGSDGCGGSCGSCGCGKTCTASGQCTFTACNGKQCGSDGCGGTCGTCGCGDTCQSGQCVYTACDARECGPDGCGGSCGSCAAYGDNAVCGANGGCTCTPSCVGKACGDDGCGGSCGDCPGAEDQCLDGQCVWQGGCFERATAGCDHCLCEQCVCAMDPWCCESDWNWWCVNECEWDCQGCGACTPSCPADPTFCGLDGCNQPCRTCPAGQACFDDHCCTPSCAAGQCGDDGCGGQCPTTCAEGQYCAEFAGGDARCHAGAAGDPCDSAERCDDGVACTTNQCVPPQGGAGGAGTCAFDASGCCANDAQCDDGDDVCTLDACQGGTCVHTPTFAAGCCKADVVTLDFEGDLPDGVTLDGSDVAVRWYRIDGVRYVSPTSALYYGDPQTGDYHEDLQSSGSVHVAGLVLPPGTRITLSFALWLDVEDLADYDTLTVWVQDGATSWSVWTRAETTPQKTWQTLTLDLSAFAGRTVEVRFAFDTVDDTVNETEGVFLDDVTVRSSCQTRTCSTAADCDDDLDVSGETCENGACRYSL